MVRSFSVPAVICTVYLLSDGLFWGLKYCFLTGGGSLGFPDRFSFMSVRDLQVLVVLTTFVSTPMLVGYGDIFEQAVGTI